MGSFVVEVERALGPGVDYDREPHGALIGRRARSGGPWLGFDQAALVESDDASGRRLRVLVALPASTFAGCRLEVEVTGGWETSSGSILVGRLAGADFPTPALARVAGNVEGGTWLDAAAAARIARLARQRYRERLSHARIAGGRAWQAIGASPPEFARFGTPHSAAEYDLARLPARFVRGLEGLLDDEERVLYWIERPLVRDLGVLERLRGRLDRRAALLALTDRQLLWLVDHAQPDHYLSDWGVDVEILPIERLADASCTASGDVAELTIATTAGRHVYTLPIELRDEAQVMRDLLTRFTPLAATALPRRRYPLEPMGFDAEASARWGQEHEARALYAEAMRGGEVLGFLFSPRRPGQRVPAAMVLRPTAVEVRDGVRCRRVALADVLTIRVTLSPLVGRIALASGVALSMPAPLMDRGAAFIRLVRRALAAIA